MKQSFRDSFNEDIRRTMKEVMGHVSLDADPYEQVVYYDESDCPVLFTQDYIDEVEFTFFYSGNVYRISKDGGKIVEMTGKESNTPTEPLPDISEYLGKEE